MSETTTEDTNVIDDAFAEFASDLDTPDDAVEQVADSENAGGEPAQETADDRPRDEHGRFVARDNEADAKATDAGEAKSPDAAQPEVVTPPQPAAEAPAVEAPKPYTVKVEGQEYAIDGATYSPDGALTIPAQSVQGVTRALQEGIYKMAHWEAHLTSERQKAEDAGRASGRAIADKLLQQISSFADLVEKGEYQPVLEWFAAYKQNLPRMQAELERDELKAKLEQRTQAEKAQAESASTEQLTAQKAQAITQELAEFKANPALKALTPEDWQELDEVVSLTRDSYFVQQEGEWYLDTNKLGLLFEKRVALRQKLQAQQKAASEAQKFNASQQPVKGAQPTAAKPARAAASQPAKGELSPAEYKRQFKNKWRSTGGLPGVDEDEDDDF